jgi:hypothetical protein
MSEKILSHVLNAHIPAVEYLPKNIVLPSRFAVQQARHYVPMQIMSLDVDDRRAAYCVSIRFLNSAIKAWPSMAPVYQVALPSKIFLDMDAHVSVVNKSNMLSHTSMHNVDTFFSEGGQHIQVLATGTLNLNGCLVEAVYARELDYCILSLKSVERAGYWWYTEPVDNDQLRFMFWPRAGNGSAFTCIVNKLLYRSSPVIVQRYNEVMDYRHMILTTNS